MNKKFTTLMAALALLTFLAAPLGMWGQTRDEVVSYTLEPASGTNNSYAGNCDIEISNITWNLTGNSTIQPWRIGGKSLTGVDRNLYSKTAIADNITKIEVTHGAASSITVNSWTVIVASDADFANVVSTLTPTFEANVTTTINRPTGVNWSNCYYKFVYNVTVSGSDNKFLQFTRAKFYKENVPTYTLTDASSANGSISFAPASPVEEGTHVTLTPTPASEAYYFVENSWSFYNDDLVEVTEDIVFVEGEANTIVMPAYNLTVDATFAVKPTYAITCVSNNESWGELSASPTSAYQGQTVTLSYSPETGYRLSSIAITKTEDGSATGITPVESGDGFTFEMPNYAVTATATFEAIPTYTITFIAGSGTCNTPTMSDLEGSTINLPTAEPSAACASRGWEFAGWATTGVSETTNAPTLLNGDYTITADADLYAVYKVTEAEGGTTEFNFAEIAAANGWENSVAYTEVTIAPVTIEAQGGGNNGKWYTNNGGSWRMYSGGTVEISVTSNNVTAVTSTPSCDFTINNGTASYSPSARTDFTSITVTYGTSTTTYNSNPSCNPLYEVVIDVLQHGNIVATPSQAEAGDEVTLTITPDECYELDELLVYDEDNDEYVTVTDNKFDMPAGNVTVMADFKLTKYAVQYSVNGTIETALNEDVDCGSSASLWNEEYLEVAEVELPEGYTFAGWSNSSSSTTVLNSYEPSNNAVLYAVFGKTTEGVVTSQTVILDGSGLTSTATTADFSYTNNEFNYILSAGAKQQSSSGDNRFADKAILIGKNGAYIYNTDAFGQGITSFEVYANKGASANVSVGIYFSTTAIESYNNASATNTWTQTLSTLDHVYDASSKLPEGAKYFWYQVTNANNSQVQFRITYNDIASTTSYFTLIKDVTGTETMASIEASHLITVKNGGVLTLTGTNNGDETNLIIEDGGQLISNSAVYATVLKNIDGYSNGGGWNFVASPIFSENGLNPSTVGMITTESDYDLYRFNPNVAADAQGVTKEWENYKVQAHQNDFMLYNGHGYLYANEEDVILQFSGVVNSPDAVVSYDYGENSESELKDWHLVGNPYMYEAYPNMSYYVVSGFGIAEPETSGTVAPCEGIMIQGTDESVNFTREPEETSAPSNLQMTLAQQVVNRETVSSTKLDKAIISFNEGSQLGKFYFGESAANIYIPQGNKEYAVVSAEAQGEMPVNFRATKNGTYTLTVNPEGVEMNYLHLIDNMTGADIDLLAATSTGSVATYTFNASTTDYSSRFRLVFAANNEDGVSTGSTAFAFYSNGTWVINNTGEATLQVVDVNGRILSSETVNGSVSKAINAPAGVYMLRLINGNDVKTQKIVVR